MSINVVASIGGALVLAMSVFMAIAWALDIREWNGGVCRRCASRWRHFDVDSQGGRGYKCEGGHTIWISYPRVDKA